jgi:CubicO group peptidase (beta-lactamase class C family)
VPSEKFARLPAFYFFNRQTNKLDFFDDPFSSAWRAEPSFESGGGGLVSTIDDYFLFSRMMLNKGRHGGEQILPACYPSSLPLVTPSTLALKLMHIPKMCRLLGPGTAAWIN